MNMDGTDSFKCPFSDEDENDGLSVESCMSNDNVDNAFELAVLTAQRSFSILDGDYITVPNAKTKNKAIVVSLREISEDNLDLDSLKFAVACRMSNVNAQKYKGMKFRNDDIDEANLDKLRDDMSNVREDAGDAVASIGITHSVKSMSEGSENTEYDTMSFDKDEESLSVYGLKIDKGDKAESDNSIVDELFGDDSSTESKDEG